MVSDDLPDPDTPVTTINLLRGMVTVTSLRLCVLAPLMKIPSVGTADILDFFGEVIFVAIVSFSKSNALAFAFYVICENLPKIPLLIALQQEIGYFYCNNESKKKLKKIWHFKI